MSSTAAARMGAISMSISPEGRRARGRLAVLKRHHGDGADIAAEEAILERDRVDEIVAKLVESWHKATPQQKARIRRLYNPPAVPEHERGATG
jgi:hypothetical protein